MSPSSRKIRHPVLLYASFQEGYNMCDVVVSNPATASVMFRKNSGISCTLAHVVDGHFNEYRNPIHSFKSILSTTQKLLKATTILDVPIIATTQLRAKLGETCAELGLDTTYPTSAHIDKSKFSMFTPEVISALKRLPQKQADPTKDTSMKRHPWDIVIVGIEAHVCVLQTVMDALSEGHRVWVVQDGVSSCNAEERPVAFERLRQEGAKVTTSESILFEMVGDASDERFKRIAALIKETKDETSENLRNLCKM